MYRYKLETQCVIGWQVQWDAVTSGEPLHTGPAVLPLHLGSKYTAGGGEKKKKNISSTSSPCAPAKPSVWTPQLSKLLLHC